MTKTYVISGAAGLIGSHFLQDLKEKCEIFALGRHKNHLKANYPNQLFHFIECDFSNDDWIKLLPQKVDYVIHLARSEKTDSFPEHAEEIFSVNTLSTLRLLEYARKNQASRFILASSGDVYGGGPLPFSELEALQIQVPKNFYYSTKLCSETLAQNYYRFMKVIILRFFFVYGPGQNQTRLIPRLIKNIQSDHSITLAGKNGIKINPIHVQDAVSALKKAVSLDKNAVINIAGIDVLSIKEICEIIGNLLNKKPLFEQVSSTSEDLVGDIQLMKKLLGTPKISFEEGITKYIEFA